MSTRNRPDRNSINIGPATIKVEDSIYTSVDQGIVGTSVTQTVTPPDGGGGFEPIGPIGDLITPPTLPPIEGYPIVFTEAGIATNNFDANPAAAWGLGDLSSIGFFENSLVTQGFSDRLGVANLDNPTQVSTYQTNIFKDYRRDFVISGSQIWHAFDVFENGVWTNPSYSLAWPDNTTQQRRANDLGIFYIQDGSYRYGVQFYSSDANVLLRQPLGSLAPPQVVGFGPPIGATGFWGAGGGVVWGHLNSFSQILYAASATTGQRLVAINQPAASASGGPNAGQCFGLTNGGLAWLVPYVSGSTRIWDLRIARLDGSITTQTAILSLPDAISSQSWAALPGMDSLVLSVTDSAGVSRVFQISSAGYQELDLQVSLVTRLRVSDAGLLRWFGQVANNNATRAFYESAL